MNNKAAVVILLSCLLFLSLACNASTLEAWGDLVETARAIWASTWTTPEPDYYAISVFCTDDLKATHGDPPEAYVQAIVATTHEIAAAWGIGQPFSQTFTIGPYYDKPDGSGRIVVPFQFANSRPDVYGVPQGSPITGLCLEFEEIDLDGEMVPLMADGYQVGDYVLPTTTPQVGYAECPSGITPTPTPTPTPIPTDTPTPSPGDGHEDDDPPNHSSIAVDESQSRTLEPTGDVDVVHLWVWSGLHLQVHTHSLGGYASTNVEIPTCSGSLADTDGGTAFIEWTSQCEEVVVITVTSSNGYRCSCTSSRKVRGAKAVCPLVQGVR